MKKILLIALLIVESLFSQHRNSFMNSWSTIIQTPEIINYFDGVFEVLGISIEETGEQFTVYHQGDTILLDQGIDPNSDFIVPLKSQNIQNMISHSKDGQITPEESWRILSVLFTPLTQVTLQSPVLSVNWRRKLAGVEDLTHVYLISPDGNEANKHTLIYVKGQWLVLEGLHGQARRTYRMNEINSLLYQRNIFSAMKKDTFIGWMQFSFWYKKWRKTVSTNHKF
tara:strand:- start:288 stop:965 length:678 start_codon:yes stop_codon:yes gene_type:complete